MREKLLLMIEELCGDEIVRENPDIDLLEEGLIDSLDYIELLLWIEEAFGLKMSPSELTREEMATPNRNRCSRKAAGISLIRQEI